VRRERERKRGSVAEMVIGRAGASSPWEVLIRSEDYVQLRRLCLVQGSAPSIGPENDQLRRTLYYMH
jgi:hypothetical protein